MIGRLGIPELVIIAVLVILIFGPKKLPQLGKSLGDTIREFRNVKTAFEDAKNETEKTINDVKKDFRV